VINPRKAGCRLAAFLIACVPLALAQGTYTQIDYPGAVGTSVIGINTAGDIVGQYADSSQVYHGFLLSMGVYTTIDYPGVSYTILYGINDLGQIVGGGGPGYSANGFLYDVQAQTFTTLSCPVRNSVEMDPYAINNAGTITGFVVVQRQNSNFPIGFELSGSTCRKVLPQGFPYSGLGGINNLGIAVGFASNPSNQIINFMFSQGKFTALHVPGTDPTVFGVNDSKLIVGANFPFNCCVAEGFLGQNGTFQRLVFPGSKWTVPGGINNAGEVVGYFYDGSNNSHGFTWTPAADAAKK